MPQPIDPNTELTRMSMAERIQELSGRASVLAQVRQRVITDEEQVLMETQVAQPEAQSEAVSEDLRRRNPYGGRRRNRKQDEQQDHRAVLSQDEAKHLDVSI